LNYTATSHLSKEIIDTAKNSHLMIELDIVEGKLNTLQTLLREKEEVIATLEDQLNSLQNCSREISDELKHKDDQLIHQQLILKSLENQIEERGVQLDHMEIILNQKDMIIEDLEKKWKFESDRNKGLEQKNSEVSQNLKFFS